MAYLSVNVINSGQNVILKHHLLNISSNPLLNKLKWTFKTFCHIITNNARFPSSNFLSVYKCAFNFTQVYSCFISHTLTMLAKHTTFSASLEFMAIHSLRFIWASCWERVATNLHTLYRWGSEIRIYCRTCSLHTPIQMVLPHLINHEPQQLRIRGMLLWLLLWFTRLSTSSFKKGSVWRQHFCLGGTAHAYYFCSGVPSSLPCLPWTR